MAFTSASLFNTEKVTLIWIFSKGVGEGAILQSQERILIYHIIFDSCGEGLQETWVLGFFVSWDCVCIAEQPLVLRVMTK